LVEQGNEQAIPVNNANERFQIIVPEALNRFPVCVLKINLYFEI
jgi:hypothetical protein